MAVTSAPAPTGLGRLALRRGRREGRRRRTNPLLVAAFVLPSLLIYGLFMVYPFLGTIHLSLTSWDGFAATKDFIGLDNYRVLFGDAEFWEALSHNLIWAVIGTAAPIIIGLPIAVMLWSGARFRLGFRAMYFLPVILPSVVQGIIWGWIYNPIFGVLNSILEAVGLGQFTTGWLGNPDTALYAVLAAAVWGTFGMIVVFFLAGLQGIDMNLVDAARVDGANAWQRTRHVLLPGIAPIFTFVLTITLVGAFSVFDVIYVLTRGGPGTATEVLAGYSYEMAFSRNYAGYGSAISMVIAVLSLVLAIAFLRIRERNRLNG
jgi:ABC-type sugar transport system permease subunit